MTKQIKVCQVLHGIVGGGSEQVVLNYCSRMSDIHFDLLYQYEPNPQILEYINALGFNSIRIPNEIYSLVKYLWMMFCFSGVANTKDFVYIWIGFCMRMKRVIMRII